MSQINVSNLTFSYEGSYDNVFENVSFMIDTDWRLGFTGRNGRGKTTFLNLLMGRYSYQGKISASVGFEYFPYEVGNEELTTLEIAQDIDGSFQEWELIRELDILKVPCEALYRPFNTLSSGEKTKVLLAVLFLKENSFLLIDEPTNHLDMAGRELLSAYLKNKKGFILVSHDRAFLDGCVDHILSINKMNIDVCKGNFSSWYTDKQRQDNFELQRNKKLKGDISKMQAAAARAANWSDKIEKTKYGDDAPDKGYIGHMAAKMMKRSKSLERRQSTAIEEKSKLLKNIEAVESLKLHPLTYKSEKLLWLENVSVSYGEKKVCGGVSFTMRQGDKIALSGKNGSGKSSILKLILGDDLSYEGIYKRASDVVISYVSQETSHLSGGLDEYIAEHGIDRPLFKAILRKLDFSREQFEKNMEDFSAGQKKKVLIAASLCQKAHLYIWDEPLNFIDVFSRMQIEQLLLSADISLIFVEHDRAFTEKIATDVIALRS